MGKRGENMTLSILKKHVVTDNCERCWRTAALSKVDISELAYYGSDGLLLCDDCISDYEEGTFTCNLCSSLATRDGYSYCDDCY